MPLEPTSGVNLCWCKASNIDGPAGLLLRQRLKPKGPPLSRSLSLSLPERSRSASVYPQTSPLVNRLGLNPTVSSFLHLSLPPSLCLLACLFTSAPLRYSCDRRKEWEEEEGGEKGEKGKCMYVCVKEREERDGTGACSARIALLA